MTSPARASALRALQTFRKTNQVSIPPCEKEADRRLCERMVTGTLQNERFLDACLSRFVTGGYRRLHPLLRDLLLLSGYQLLFLDRVPASAVVNDAVSLCRSNGLRHQAGFVNAVLRRVSEQREALLSLALPAAVRYSHPDWMAERLDARFGPDFTEALMRADQEPPQLRLQVNTLRCRDEDYLAMLAGAGVEVLFVNRELSSVSVHSTAVETLPGYAEGLFFVQDDAARLAVRLAGLRPGMRVLDVCAAPGGKSVAALLEGAEPLACDVSSRRLQRCEENARRLGLEIPLRVLDATVFTPELEAAFPAVLADAPCSGTGVIRRHPEIRRKTESDFRNLLSLQQAILDNVSRYVAPGGFLLYSTCSVMEEENEAQVRRFLEDHPGFALEPIGSGPDPVENGMYHSWPHLGGNDGFFAAKLRHNHD